MITKSSFYQRWWLKAIAIIFCVVVLTQLRTATVFAAVAYDASSESHTGTTGSTNVASFTWNHVPVGTPRGVLVFVTTAVVSSDNVTSVTYGGVSMTEITAGLSRDTATEQGRQDVFFLGSSVPTGTQAVVVNRSNNANSIYATAITVTAAADTEPFGIVLLQENGTFAVQSVNDGSPGTNSVRFAVGFSGGSNILAAGTGSTVIQSLDYGVYTNTVAYETTAGQGARNVGFTYGTTDDRAATHLAVREKVALSGVLYQSDETTPYQCATAGNVTIALRVNGAGSYSATCTADTGAWSISNIDNLTSGNSVYIYTSGGSVRGSTAFITAGNIQTNIPIYQDKVLLRDDANGSVSVAEILTGNTASADDLITTTGTDLVVSSSYETHIYTGDTFAPGANVTTGKLHVVGSYTGSSETLTLTASGTSTSRPLYINGGSWSTAGTTVFQGTSATDIDNQTYSNLTFSPTITGNVTYTFLGGLSILGNFQVNPTSSGANRLTVNLGGTTTITAGKTLTLTGTTSALSTLDTLSASNYSLSAGAVDIASAGTLTLNNSTLTLTSTSGTLFTRSGTFNAGGSTVVVNPNASITLTSGTVTFNNLTLSPTMVTSAKTYTFGSGAVTIDGNFSINPLATGLSLTVVMAGDITVANNKTTTITKSSTTTSVLQTSASNPTLSTGNLNIATDGTLEGASPNSSSIIKLTANGTPFTRTGTYNPGSTTITYEPVSTSGVTVTSGTYNNVTFNKASNTFSLTTSGITVTNDLTITAGVLDVVNTQNYPITVGRNWTNSVGTAGFEARAGTVTFNTTTTASITGQTTFYGFTAATAGKTIKFGDGTTFRINGLLTLTGSAGPSYVTLDSVSGGATTWTINHQGTEAITYTSVKNSACDGSSTAIDATGTGNHDAGNNGICWSFPSTLSDTAYWKMDEGHGTTVLDSSNTGTTGTLAGASLPVWQTEDMCVSGKCLYFEGSSAKVTGGNTVNVKTVSFWAKPMVLTNVFLQLTSGAYISSDSGGTLSATGFSSPTIYVNGIPKTTIEANKWQFITVTTASNISASAIILGNNASTYYQGFLDEVRFNNTAFTAAEVKGDFAKKGAVEPVSANFGPDNTWLTNGLVGYWKMDETSGPALDSSGNGTNGTWNADVAAAEGKFGYSTTFDGTGDYIAANAAAAKMSPVEGSISLWARPSTTSNLSMIGLGGSSLGSNIIAIQTNTTAIRTLYRNGGNFHTAQLNSAYSTNEWYQVVATWKDGIISICVNGSCEKGAYTEFAGNFTYLTIGGEVNEYANDPSWNGRLDDIRLYNRALNQSEIQALSAWAPGPIAYWNFDENTGTTAKDISVNENLATFDGSPLWVPGKFGSALAFNGSSTQLSVPDDPSLDLGANSFTVSAWVRYNGTAGSQDFILHKWESGVAGGFGLNIQSGGTMRFGIENDGSGFPQDSATSTASYDDGKWHYVTGVKTGISKIDLYVDGILVATDASLGTVTTIDNSNPLYLGARYNASQQWLGDIDEIKIYNYARTPGQIIEDMNGNHPLGGSPIGSQVGYWRFDEGFGDTANDAGPLAKNANLSGSTACPSATICPTWSNSGKFGKALYFGGLQTADGDSHLRLPDDAYDSLSEGAISFWFKPDDAGDTNQNIFSVAEDDDNAYSDYFSLQTDNANNRLTFGVINNGTLSLVGQTGAISNYGSWHHVVFNMGNTGSSIYIDGKKQSITYTSGSSTTHLWFDDISENTTTFSIGCATADGSNTNDCDDTELYQGYLDELKLYSSPLTEAQVLTEYNRGTATSLGVLSSESSAGAGDRNSASREYCVPGESVSCNPPVLYMPLDENSGTTTANDISGNGNSGSVTASTGYKWETGKKGPAVYFNDSKIDANSVADDIASGGLTYSAYFKLRDTFNSSTTASRYIFYLGDTDGSSDNDVNLYLGGTDDTTNPGTLKFCAYTGAAFACAVSTETSWSPGVWYHAVGVLNTTSGMSLYVNGLLSDTDTNTARGTTDATEFKIGSNWQSNQRFDGVLDDLKVYDYARSPSQVAWDYNHGQPIAWYKLDDCTGTVIQDSSGNGFNGTLSIGGSGTQTATGTCGGTAGAWLNGLTGKINSSLSVDGTDDVATIGFTSTKLPFSSPKGILLNGSVSFWYKTPSTVNVTERGIISTGRGVDEGVPSFLFQLHSSTIRAYTEACQYFVGYPVVASTWYHLALIADATTHKFYVNGELIESKSINFGGLTNYHDNLYLGSGYLYPTQGLIDDVRMYNYPLSPAQLKTVYTNGAVSF